MKRLSLLLLLLYGCSSELHEEQSVSAIVEDKVRIEFKNAQSVSDMGDAHFTEFHYLTYDYYLGSWVGELGGIAVWDEDPYSPFLPSDASRVYWPEGRSYSFYAAAHNENVSVSESDTEFGTALILYNSGTSAIVKFKNPGHNVDWLAAKLVRQEKIDGIPLSFRHICAKVSKLTYDLSAYREWIEAKELDIADVMQLTCTLSDAEEQTYIYSADGETLFTKESGSYTGSSECTLDNARSLCLSQDGCSVPVEFYAFAGSHTFKLRIQTVDADGNQVVDDRTLSTEVMLPMGADCELKIRILPYDRDLYVELSTAIGDWEDGGSGNVAE